MIAEPASKVRSGRGRRRTVDELGAVIGYYTMVSMALNAHQLPLPEGSVGLPVEDRLITLPPGAFVGEHAKFEGTSAA